MGQATRTHRATRIGWLSACSVALAACLLCAGLAVGEERTLRLSDLEGSPQALLSCDGGGGELPSSEPLWCADSDSPLCAPATPRAPHHEVWQCQPALLSAPFVLSNQVAVLLDLPRTRSEQTPPDSRARERLERPPRV